MGPVLFDTWSESADEYSIEGLAVGGVLGRFKIATTQKKKKQNCSKQLTFHHKLVLPAITESTTLPGFVGASSPIAGWVTAEGLDIQPARDVGTGAGTG